jgi:Protein of unknown function (DUF3631)
VRFAGPENLARLESNLRRNQTALKYLHGRGLAADTIRKFHLGLREPCRRTRDGRCVTDVLCYPLLTSTGDVLGKYGCYAIPDVTEGVAKKGGWGRGRPATYYSGPAARKSILLVADDCFDLWVLDQRLTGTGLGDNCVIVAPSHGPSVPSEWKLPAFWSRWSSVYFVQRSDASGDLAARALGRFCAREVLRVCVPEGKGRGWTEFFLAGGTSEEFEALVRNASVLSSVATDDLASTEQSGEFAVNPVNINGAFVNGHLYYPFTVERREMEEVTRKGRARSARLVTSYVTKVVRSDGAVLDIVRFPAPKGTPHERQVLALTDGTRIEKAPQPSHYATWQLDSIQSFIRATQGRRPAPHRPLKSLLAEVDAHLRRSVWLPYRDDYAVLTLYVALSFVYQVFEAIPLIMVRGEKGTGKSELGDAVSRVSCNATVIGQGSAASLVRLLNEARGLVVLDDLESIGRALEGTAFGDVGQMLKLSYKRGTGRKAITDKNGKTAVFDFYGPKVVNNTRGADPILGSRMLNVQTRRIPDGASRAAFLTGSEPEELARLRNELHVWGMAEARLVHERYARLVESRRDRQGEIAAPLRALAELSGDDGIRQSLESALVRWHTRRGRIESPAELLKEAIDNCIRGGATEHVSASQLLLELRQLAEENPACSAGQARPAWRRPEWVGHQLLALGARDPRTKVRRARLYGLVTRIYELQQGYVREVLEGSDAGGGPPPAPRAPFAFCEEATCGGCPYDGVCASTVIGLKARKRMNRGKSGRRA